jgi:hypothetical protein
MRLELEMYLGSAGWASVLGGDFARRRIYVMMHVRDGFRILVLASRCLLSRKSGIDS